VRVRLRELAAKRREAKGRRRCFGRLRLQSLKRRTAQSKWVSSLFMDGMAKERVPVEMKQTENIALRIFC
jgi:hypothetical protein